MTRFDPDSPLVKRVQPSPNHGSRKGMKPSAIILHYTEMRTVDAALAHLCNPKAAVSAHYVIDEDGAIFQLVPEAQRAWHAGVSNWCCEADMNSASIGIEIQNGGAKFGAPAYPGAQIDALIGLCRDIQKRHAIPSKNILGHSDIAPGRKADPGEKFPWDRLAAAGVGLYVPPQPIAGDEGLKRGDEGAAVWDLQRKLLAYGYGVDVTGLYDERTEAVVTAFQRHFRPARVDGRADRSTFDTLRDVLAEAPDD